ncbi:MAG: VWA domain-containing protein [bacterium]|nr:VWA domain-containing protein [bacterium]
MNKQQGLTLFIAIIIISIVGSIGLSLSLIASKQFTLSKTRRESQAAYYAAEAGMQCTLYWLLGDRETFSTTQVSKPIRCDDQGNVISPAIGKLDFGVEKKFEFNYQGYPFHSKVKVTALSNGSYQIESEGYNKQLLTGNGVTLQRAQKVEVVSGFETIPHDIVFVVDNSGSIDGINGSGRPTRFPPPSLCASAGVSPCMWSEFLKNAVSSQVSEIAGKITTPGTPGGFRVGLVNFASEVPATRSIYRRSTYVAADIGSSVSTLQSAIRTTIDSQQSGTNMPAGLLLASLELQNRRRLPDPSISSWTTGYCVGGAPGSSSAGPGPWYHYCQQGRTFNSTNVGSDPSAGARNTAGVPKIVILITDGGSDYVISPDTGGGSCSGGPTGIPCHSNTSAYGGTSFDTLMSTADVAEELRDEEDITIFVVGVALDLEFCPAGPGATWPDGDCSKYLETQIASQGKAFQTYYGVDDYSKLKETLKKIFSSGVFSVKVIY